MMNDPLGAVMLEVNVLASTLHDQRLGALEAGALLQTVMVEIDVAVFTFDGSQTLKLVNRAGERLLARAAEQLLGRTAEELGLDCCLEGQTPRIADVDVPRRRRTLGGAAHDVPPGRTPAPAARARRREPAAARRGAPGVAAAHSRDRPRDQQLARADQVDRRQPRDHAGARFDARGLERRHAARARRHRGAVGLAQPLHDRLRAAREAAGAARADREHPGAGAARRGRGDAAAASASSRGPEVTIRADPDQLEQLLINVVRNAVDAALQTGGGVTIGWKREGRSFELWVDDEGGGLPNASNLFVPFFTTKPGGSGIGLVLSRQIAEAHGGTLTLENRPDAAGCRAHLRLPA